MAQEHLPEYKNNQIKFESLGSKEGLKHNTINIIYQDSRGYMWFGAFNGIYKYDGYNFKLFKKNKKNIPIFREDNITNIYEDDFETLWVGTRQGLYYYDRYSDSFSNKIQLEKSRNVVLKDEIFYIYQDSNHTLWISAASGLYQLDRRTSKKQIFKFKKINNISLGNVNTILEDKNGKLLFGTNKGLKIIKVDNVTIDFIDYIQFLTDNSTLQNLNITALSNDNLGNIWVGTTNGLNKINCDSNGNFIHIDNYNHDKNNIKSLSGNHITAICPDKDGTIWIGTNNNGLNRFLYEKNSFSTYKKNALDKNSISSNQINTIYQSKNHIIWIGCRAGAVNKLDPFKKQFLHYNSSSDSSISLSDNMINFIYEDTSKNLWICTQNGGVNMFRYNKSEHLTINHLKALKSDNAYSSMCEDNFGNFWIGTSNSGLYHVQLKNSETLKNPLKISHLSKESGHIPTNSITSIYKDHEGDVWMGLFENNSTGLMKFTPNQFGEDAPKIFNFKLNSRDDYNNERANYIATIYEDKNNILWIGTYGSGIKKIIRNEKNEPIDFSTIQHNSNDENSLSNNNVFSFHEDVKGNLWIGTFGGGLNKIEKDEKYKKNPKIISYTEKNGLTNEELYGVLEDDKGDLWISSNNGIYRFNVTTETFINYQIDDGLQELNFRKQAFLKSSEGLLYFGGINGVDFFEPSEFEENPFAPIVEIVSFKLFNKDVEIDQEILGRVILFKSIEETEEIVLNHNHKSFSFEFSALHYSSPKQNKYAYMLEGWDSDWIYTDTKKRNVSYSNLEQGTYIFKVKAANNDNLWNDNFKQIKITILPALWKTWWAYSIYVLIIIGLLWWFRQSILIKENYRTNLQIEKLSQEKIKEVNNLKLEFFTNISHEFKTPLTLILGPLQSMIDLVSKGEKIKKSSLILMNRNAKRLSLLVNQIIEFREIESKKLKLNLSKGDIVGFVREIVSSFNMLAITKGIKLHFKCNELTYYCINDWEKIEKILNNLIVNAIKFTGNKGKINIDLSILNDGIANNETKKLILKVSDTGKGIPDNELQFIFNRFYRTNTIEKMTSPNSGIGLAFTKSLVELLNGTIEVKSTVKVGSTFKVELPINLPLEDNSESNYKIDPIDGQISFDSKDYINNNTDNPSKKEDAPKTLLIVEDNHDLQTFIKESFELNYRILQAYDGTEGFAVACEKIPDIIISDIMMPNKDGIELCAMLRNSHITNHIPIILLTAKSAIESKIEGLNIGADAYISKPFNLDHLNAQIENLLNQRELLRKMFSNTEEYSSYSKIPKIKDVDKDFLEKAEKIIETNLVNHQFDVENFCDELNLSQMQLYRKLKSITGSSINEFIRNYRLKKAAQLLRETNSNITEVLYEVGYSSRSYFTKSFKESFNMTTK